MKYIYIFFICIQIIYYCKITYSEEISKKNYFQIARLQYQGGGDWYNDPSIIPNLSKEFTQRTGIKINTAEKVVQIENLDFFSYPFLFITGHGNIYFSPAEIEKLKIYMENGGFIYVDDDYGMDSFFKREIAKVFPDKKLVEIPFSHPIYNIYYKFNNGLPKIHEHYEGRPIGYGLFVNGRLSLFYTYNTNISDGWASPEVHKDPPSKREEAFKMGINILLYNMLE
ncbi:DUF4159 domain-containing protein [Candidatus Poribacteria bacterium]|nr:DUF4159 domain-containing protein [Candidatus Poribacteria bacterium]